jgi:large subunit ribosomal protein L21
VTLGDVLLAGEGSELKKTDGLTVSAEIIAQAKGEKVTVFKKRRRHNYRRKKGHRQQHTILRITAIGDRKAEPKAKSAKTEAPKAAEKPAKAEAPKAEKKAAAAKAEKAAAPKAKAPSTKNAAPAKGAAKKSAPKAKK